MYKKTKGQSVEINRRTIIVSIIVLLCFGIIMTGCTGFSVYDSKDVEVINTIIEENNLDIRKNTPSKWEFVLWTEETPKRIKTLYQPQQIAYGVVDLSDLDALEKLLWYSQKTDMLILPENVLDVNLNRAGIKNLDCSRAEKMEILECSGNELTELDLSAAKSLERLDCQYNQLISLDLKKCMNLRYLNCAKNQLAVLNIDGLNKLETLYCCENDLAELIIIDLPKLESVDCKDNPLETFHISNVPALKALLCSNDRGRIQWTDGITFVSFDYPSRVITLNAEPPKGYFLGGITNLPEGVEIVDNTVQFQLPYSFYELTPRFWELSLKKE